jgi:hypothetical protein
VREEVKRILKMVQEGKLTAEQAEELIEAYEAGEAADAGVGGPDVTGNGPPPPPPPPPPTGERDPFRAFVETIERIGKEATDSVNWQDVAKQVREGAKKGVETLKTGVEQVSKGKVGVTFPWLNNHETREVTLPLSIASGKTLRVDNSCGDVKIVGGFDVGSVTARAKFRAATPEDAKAKADSYTLIIEESEHMVLIRQPDVSGLSVDVEVQMPGTGAVEVRCTSGDISVLDTGAAARVDGVSGDIRLRGLNGPIEVSGTSGDISVEDCTTPSLAVENKSGDLVLRRVSGNLNARTAGGDVRLEDCSGKTMSIEAVSGDVSVDIAEPITGTVNVRTVSGDASVGLMDGADCRVSLSTLRGDVSCSVPLSDEAKTGQRVTGRLGGGQGTLDVSAVTGDVSVYHRGTKTSS